MPTLEEIFVYTGPDPADLAKLELAATKFLNLATAIEQALPENRFRDKAMQHLEAGFHQCINAVFRHVEPPEDPTGDPPPFPPDPSPDV